MFLTQMNARTATFVRLAGLALADFHEFGRFLLTGALVVVPVWLVLRLLDARRPR